MTAVEGLVEFLTARLDEREAWARAATGAPWEEFSGAILSKAGGLTTVAETHNLEVIGIEGYTYPPDEQQLADARYIAGNDPAFVLADIAAKRRLIGLHLSVEDRSWMSGEPNGWLWCSTCGTTDDHPIAWPCETLKLLGLPFSDRPGYRQEWTP